MTAVERQELRARVALQFLIVGVQEQGVDASFELDTTGDEDKLAVDNEAVKQAFDIGEAFCVENDKRIAEDKAGGPAGSSQPGA